MRKTTDPSSDHGQALPSGTRLEQFLIERVLGSGGFGITYLARDSRLNRQVVIKENLPVQFCFRDTHSLTVAPRQTHGDDAENFRWSMENFSREAEMLASLDHPGIVRILQSFEYYGTAYFVMPFVDGVAFDELIQERHGKARLFSEEELRGLMERVLGALGYLHERGIYHRDIKPGNILITMEGVPVLIDFGSARQRLSERSLTVVESAGYTPFEQLQSRGNVGPWSDLYALAGTVVKAITGETLPKANDRVFDDPWQGLASRRELLDTYSQRLLVSIDKALALHPRDRWQHAGEWMSALCATTAPSAGPPPPETQPTVIPGIIIRTHPCAASTDTPPALSAYQSQAGMERDFELVNGCQIIMCWIPPGEFVMGSPADEIGRREDEVQHVVRITRGFWMGKYPITQGQWRAVMQTNPSSFGRMDLRTRLDSEACARELARWDHHPVENVCWDDICHGARGSKGFLDGINAWRGGESKFGLPTEAEWEYACRAGIALASNISYSPQDELDAVAWYCRNSDRESQPVGLKQPNAWGLHDMLGNVWEWCADHYAAYPNCLVTDPQQPDTGMSRANPGICRVLRGGCWANDALRCRIACRDYNYPDHTNDSIGFRLVLRNVAP